MAADDERGKRLLGFTLWELFLVVAVGVISYCYDDIKHQFPWLITWQLKTYSWLSPAPASTNHVVGVEIDDRTFYGYLNNSGQYDVTRRSVLAKLIKVAIKKQAAVIALDINLDRTAIDDPGGSELKGDEDLCKEIYRANQQHIPVVLVFGFQNAKDAGPIPFLFLDDPKADESSPPPLLRGGFDHAPDDRRKVPLEVVRQDGSYWSFALQIVDAYEAYRKAKGKQIKQLTRTRLQEQRENGEFVYTSYLERCQFDHVSAADLLCDPNATNTDADCVSLRTYQEKVWKETHDSSNEVSGDEQNCPGELSAANAETAFKKDSIVLIGGNRHRYPDNGGSWLDTYKSPVGDMRGMYFQANYVEGLLDLDHRILFTVPRVIATAIDVFLAAVLLFLLGKEPSKLWKLVWVLAVLIVPIVLAFGLAFIPVAYLIDGVLALLLLGVFHLLRHARANADRRVVFGLAAAFFVLAICVWAYFDHRRYALDFMLPLVLLCLHPALERYVELLRSYTVDFRAR